jgi:TonB-dependent SusC/RagA subfamily outer membrane receptor
LAACRHGSNAEPQGAPGARVVTSDDIQHSPGQPIEDILQSKFPGVTVARAADGGLAIRIRGSSSFSANDAPLYVVDGIKVQPGPSGGLPGINPYDIESIQVLKDPVSMVTYGGQAANGVIVIRTKKPPQ